MRVRTFTSMLLSVGVIGLLLGPSDAQPLPLSPVGGRAVETGVSPALRSIRPGPPQPQAVGEREIPNRPIRPSPPPKRKTATVGVVKSLGQPLAPAPSIPATTSTFEGISNAANRAVFGFPVLPPDTNGDVGSNHYVQSVNLLFQVFDKAGTPLTAPRKISSLFVAAGLRGACAITDDGDPIVLYDHLADRWLISKLAEVGPPSHECIAISQTGDPTGTYFVYDFPMPNNKFNDFPKFGVWPDAYYMTDNQFTTVFAGAGIFAFDRKKMLVGDPTASFIYFDLALLDPSIAGLLPSDLDGPPPPVGTPNYLAYFTAAAFGDPQGDALRIFEFHADFNSPADSTLTERPESPILTAPFDPNMCNFARNCIPQPDPTANLDALSDRLNHRLQYRNFGGHESLVVNHTVDVDLTNHAGIRYYELRRPLPRGAFAISEQATFAPDADHRWMGSAAMDNQGNLAVGFSVSSAITFPSIRYAGRLATDPPGGLFQGEAILQAGAGSQTSATSRWGDYSMLAVDPTDDCTFWYTNEYYAATSVAGWQTRIGSFKFPVCTPSPRGTLQGTVTDASTALPIAGAVVQTSDGFVRMTNGSGVYTMNVPPGSYTVTASAPGHKTLTVSGVVVSNGVITTQDFALTSGADLSVSIADSPDPVKFGADLTYTITVRNNGPLTATGVTLTDTLPASATFLSATPSQGSCAEAGGTVSCALGALASGASALVTITVKPTALGTIVNTASVAANEFDPNLTNNTSTQPTQVIGVDLTGSWVSVTQTCRLRCVIRGTFALKNQGTAMAGASMLRFYLSSDPTFDPATDTLLRSARIPRLRAGLTRTVRFFVRLPTGVSASGQHLIAVVDATNAVAEANKTNNIVLQGPLP